jgi:molybdopterin biosynthesis enzyme
MAFVAGSSQAPRSVDDHLRAVLADLSPLPPYEVPLLEALGLPVCENVTAPTDLPRFDNSAMDGYAVRVADVASASDETPQTLPVAEESAAGSDRSYALTPGQAIKIMTGAALPTGADSVVPVEWTDAGSSTVRITRAPRRDNTYVQRARTSLPVMWWSATAPSSAHGRSGCSPRWVALGCSPDPGHE